MAKEKTFCVRRRDADPQAVNGSRLIHGTRKRVESFLIGEYEIEPASVEESNELGAAGVKIEQANTAG